jgi:hypothetical protein
MVKVVMIHSKDSYDSNCTSFTDKGQDFSRRLLPAGRFAATAMTPLSHGGALGESALPGGGKGAVW